MSSPLREEPIRADPSPEAVGAQVRRILADPTFQASPARRDLLRFVVEETLAGRADRLKGFTIALAVFGRTDGFDPQADPVVRVEARRLRRDLHSYYAAAGRRDPVVISIPKGGYVPQFEWGDVETAGEAPPSAAAPAAPASVDRADRRRRWSALTLSALALVGALGWAGAGRLGSWQGSHRTATDLPRGPKIAVLPFLSLGEDPAQTYFAQGITDQIVTDLARFKALSVVATQAAVTHQEPSADPQRLRQELGIDYLLTGSVRNDEDQIRLSARLVDAGSGQIIWSEAYRRALSPSDIFEIQDDISRQVSAVIGSSYGVIAEAGQTEAQRRPPTSLAAYDCVLRYYHYQRSFDPPEHARVRACLERAVELEPDYAEAWAVLANVYAQEHRQRYNPRPALYDARERSLEAAKRAVAIEPRNPTAQLMLANALFDRHDLAGFEAAAERARALNPNDPDILAHFGLRLVYMGAWERGLALVTRAIALNPEFPAWYQDPLIFQAYQAGDYERALAEVERGDFARLWRLLFKAMTLGQLGRHDEAQPLLRAALERRPDVPACLWDMARVWNVPDAHIERMADGLRKAGLAIAPAPAAEGCPSSVAGRGPDK